MSSVPPLWSASLAVRMRKQVCVEGGGGDGGGGEGGGNGGGDGEEGVGPNWTFPSSAMSPLASPWSSVFSFPSLPFAPEPQHLTLPSLRITHVCVWPAEMSTAVFPSPKLTADSSVT